MVLHFSGMLNYSIYLDYSDNGLHIFRTVENASIVYMSDEEVFENGLLRNQGHGHSDSHAFCSYIDSNHKEKELFNVDYIRMEEIPYDNYTFGGNSFYNDDYCQDGEEYHRDLTKTYSTMEEIRTAFHDFAKKNGIEYLAEGFPDNYPSPEWNEFKVFNLYGDNAQASQDGMPENLKTGYTVEIAQHDITEYPKVRLYVNVTDENGNPVNEIASNLFYIAEKDASGNFIKRNVDKATKINQTEALTINMLADTSSSMSGGYIESAKNIMIDFLDTVQFDVGDQVKLTQFNTEIEKGTFFTNDRYSLDSTINGYDPSGSTKLYDAIIYGVQDVSSTNGARCVIAFTDGEDTCSYNSVDEVVDVVSRYGIPVFIVQIGTTSSSEELRRIADASGGFYTNLDNFDSSMTELYNRIYRQMKEYYLVEFTAQNSIGEGSNAEYKLYVDGSESGGLATVTIDQSAELFDSLLGAYLRSYIRDMNDGQYNYLGQYVEDNVDDSDHAAIKWQMKKQVTGGFDAVFQESLMDYYISDIQFVDSQSVIISAVEDYDVTYKEDASYLTSTDSTHVDEQNYVKSYGIADSPEYSGDRYFQARVRQCPQYLLRVSSDGQWKFVRYEGDLSLSQERSFYNMYQ